MEDDESMLHLFAQMRFEIDQLRKSGDPDDHRDADRLEADLAQREKFFNMIDLRAESEDGYGEIVDNGEHWD